MRGLIAESVGDDGFAVDVVGGVEGLVAGGFLCGDGGIEFAGGDLFGRGVDVAEFAGGEISLGSTHRRSKRPADDGAGFVVFVGDAGGGISGEVWVQAGAGGGCSGLDALGFFGV